MKSFILLAGFFLFSQNSMALNATGTYKVSEGCKVNSLRLAPLPLMFQEGTYVEVGVDTKRQLLTFTADHNTAGFPLSSEAQLKSAYFGDYYTKAKISINENSYMMTTRGSEFGSCSNEPFPGSHPCLQKWNDGVAVTLNNSGDLEIQWKIDKKQGTCLLQKL